MDGSIAVAWGGVFFGLGFPDWGAFWYDQSEWLLGSRWLGSCFLFICAHGGTFGSCMHALISADRSRSQNKAKGMGFNCFSFWSKSYDDARRMAQRDIVQHPTHTQHTHIPTIAPSLCPSDLPPQINKFSPSSSTHPPYVLVGPWSWCVGRARGGPSSDAGRGGRGSS